MSLHVGIDYKGLTPENFHSVQIENQYISNFTFRGIKNAGSALAIQCNHCQTPGFAGCFLEAKDTNNVYFLALMCLRNAKRNSEEKKILAIYNLLTKIIVTDEKQLSENEMSLLIKNKIIPADTTNNEIAEYILDNLAFSCYKQLVKKFGDRIQFKTGVNKIELKKRNFEPVRMEPLKKQKNSSEIENNSNNIVDESTENRIEFLEVDRGVERMIETNPFTDSTVMERGVRLAQPNAHNITTYALNTFSTW
jgi:hypothetical protein